MHDHHPSNLKLALQATSHCSLGCGLGDIFGMIIGTALGLAYVSSIIFGIFAGFIFGYLLGILPLMRAGMSFSKATKIVTATEFISIAVMETAEALTEYHFPGMKMAGLMHLRYWIGLTATLAIGFIAALPVNLWLVRRGIRHQH